MKLVEMKKQRESLRNPVNEENKGTQPEQSLIDELPMQELLGADPEPRRLGKRPRLDCNPEIPIEVSLYFPVESSVFSHVTARV